MYRILIIIFCFWTFGLAPLKAQDQFTEVVQVALREVGNQLLLANKDSTSLVLPIIKTDTLRYALHFEAALAINPEDLVRMLDASFKRAKLPHHYRVSLKECVNEAVVYSHDVFSNRDDESIVCAGRVLPESCYFVEIRFLTTNSQANTEEVISVQNNNNLKLLAAFFILLFLIFIFLYNKNTKNKKAAIEEDQLYTTLGSFYFYPEQNKLVREALAIGLSKKECEILTILVDQANQTVKREELSKRVWEDQGVVVGRSLDTYISKLRKKLQDDGTIKITNIHGVGYKLEF